MKKISILLSGLALLIGSVGQLLPVMALDDTENNMNNRLSLVKNAVDPYFQVNLIKYKDKNATGVVTAPEGDWYIKTIIVAQMNFGQGVTEEAADRNLENFTGKSENWDILSSYSYSQHVQKKTADITMNKYASGKNVYTNKSDLLYYAVEFGKVFDGKWQESFWDRGKIDYRRCVHSAVFNEDTMVCKLVEDGSDVVKYVPQEIGSGILVYPPENEQVVDWEEEWKDVIVATYRKVQDELELISDYYNNGLMILNQDDEILVGVGKSVEHYSPTTDPRLMWMNQNVTLRRAKIVELKKFFDKPEDKTAEMEELMAKNAELKSKNEALEGEKAALQQEKVDLEEKSMTLQQKNTELMAANTNLQQKSAVLEQNVEELQLEIARLKQENEELQTQKPTDEEYKKDENVENDSEKIEDDAVGDSKGDVNGDNEAEADGNGESEKKNDTEKNKVEAVKPTEVEEEGKVVVIGNANITDDSATSKGPNEAEKSKLPATTEEKKKEAESQDVELPLLGEEEVRTVGGWWWLIPVVGLLGMVIWVVQRKFNRE